MKWSRTTRKYKIHYIPVSILHKSIAGRDRPVRVADGPITARHWFIKNASWVLKCQETFYGRYTALIPAEVGLIYFKRCLVFGKILGKSFHAITKFYLQNMQSDKIFKLSFVSAETLIINTSWQLFSCRPKYHNLKHNWAACFIKSKEKHSSNKSNTVDSRYPEVQGTLWNTSRYQTYKICRIEE